MSAQQNSNDSSSQQASTQETPNDASQSIIIYKATTEKGTYYVWVVVTESSSLIFQYITSQGLSQQNPPLPTSGDEALQDIINSRLTFIEPKSFCADDSTPLEAGLSKYIDQNNNLYQMIKDQPKSSLVGATVFKHENKIHFGMKYTTFFVSFFSMDLTNNTFSPVASFYLPNLTKPTIEEFDLFISLIPKESSQYYGLDIPSLVTSVKNKIYKPVHQPIPQQPTVTPQQPTVMPNPFATAPNPFATAPTKQVIPNPFAKAQSPPKVSFNLPVEPQPEPQFETTPAEDSTPLDSTDF